MTPWRYGNYVILERLGVGGMSEVDLARKVVEEASFVRFVVIKRIKANRVTDEAFVRMFMDEARITSELHHANIAQVYDFGREQDEYYLALEYVPGMDARRLVNLLRERGERLPVPVALQIVCEVLDGLQYAHNKTDTFGQPMHIVHRDVNPRNIMISIRGDIKLIDFGVAKATGRLEHTRTDHVKGKFAYMAPEQISAERVDHRADLFAVGITLHELLMGYGPFYGLNQVQIMHRLVAGQIGELDLPEVPATSLLHAVHRRSLQKDPRLRYQDALSFKRDLERVAEELGGLPDRRAMARFLEYVEPGLKESVQDKLSSYAGPVDAETRELPPPKDLVPPKEEQSVSGSTMTAVRRTGLFAAGGLFLMVLVAGGVIGVGSATFLAAWYGLGMHSQGQAVQPTPEPIAIPTTAPPTPTTEPSVESPEDPLPGPDTEPPPVEPQDEGQADPPPHEIVEVPPEPPPADEPPEEPPPGEADPVEVVEPPPDPDAGTTEVVEAPPATVDAPDGFLMITSTDKGRRILIDGVDTGQVTPQKKLAWPSGSHQIQVEGYPPQTVDLPEGQYKRLTFK